MEHEMIMKKAYQIIGAEIKIYGHFDVYSIPDENGRSITDTTCVTLDNFLNLIVDFFNNKEKINSNYGNDLKEQNEIKRFIKSRITPDCEEIGRKWCEECTWKEAQ